MKKLLAIAIIVTLLTVSFINMVGELVLRMAIN